MNVLLEIRSKINTLSKTNKRIAEFILKEPNQVLNLTALEIAEKCDTSSATVVRFVKQLGVDGLDNFKIFLSRDASEATEKIDSIIHESDDTSGLCERMHQLSLTAVEDLFYQLDKDNLLAAITAIQKAKNVYLLGIGASSLPAYDLYHKFNRVNIRSMFNFDAHMNTEFFNFITTDDVVIAFSYSGSSSEVVYPVEIALEKGAKVIAITRNQKSRLAECCSILLSVPDSEQLARVGAIASKYSMMIVADLLYLGAIQKDLSRLERSLMETRKLTKKLKVD